ncbi:GNAT family N-acetyltransferase [Streptomyces noursei]|uniref:GNAT family N-acetyltransferase n=1 Tax=Streptomyces noursei TaxID=1971 RepID=UPI00167428B0|nr:GNAT family N-acetyltransferase [Streptomyces noursei]MCZ1021381.1 GNAT family N-acetyltransferase [Streptomyces noursei]GGX56411.1 hypothetical protein GCM10010341_91200 [Streptomyces noursei]
MNTRGHTAVRPRQRLSQRQQQLDIAARALEGDAATLWIREHWSALYAGDPHASAYASPQWLLAWVAQLPEGSTPLILTVAEGNTPLAALALARHVEQGDRQIVSPLSAPHAECVEVVGPGASRPGVAAAMADYLTQRANSGLAIALTDVPAESPLARELLSRSGWHTRHVPNALVHLPLAWQSMAPSMRRQHAKRERRLRTGAHDIVYRRTRTTGELLAAYEVLDQLHSARWDSSPSPTGTDIRWSDILRHCTSGVAFIASITIDGIPAASQLCLFRSQVCFSLRPAMNPHLGRLAPGHLLLRRLSDDLSSAGFTELDLGRTKETSGQLGYKQQYFPEWKKSMSFCTHPSLSGPE